MKGYRKISFAVLLVVIATAMVTWGKVTDAEFTDMMKWFAGLYLGANAVQAVGVKAAERVTITPKEPQ